MAYVRSLVLIAFVCAAGAAGSQAALQADRAPPTKPSIAGPRRTTDTTPTFRFTSRDKVTPAGKLRYRCSVDSARLRSCPARYTPRLAVGAHRLRAQAVDKAGNRSAVATAAVTIVEDDGLDPGELRVESLWRISIGASNAATGSHWFALAADSRGAVFVADTSNDRISAYDAGGQLVGRWGASGTGPGQFRFSGSGGTFGGIAVDGDGNVYVADSGNARVQKFDSAGRFLAQWGTAGEGDGQFMRVFDTAVDAQGNVFVVDDLNPRVQRFDRNGVFTGKFAETALDNPSGVEVDGAGNVYVSEARESRVKKFGPTGALVATLGARGTAPGQFRGAAGISVDAQGAVYVVDLEGRRIQKFGADGAFVGYWRVTGAREPIGVAADRAGNVFVSTLDGMLEKFRLVPSG